MEADQRLAKKNGGQDEWLILLAKKHLDELQFSALPGGTFKCTAAVPSARLGIISDST